MSSVLSAIVAFLKWKPVRWTLLSIIGLVLAAVAALYGASAWLLSRTYEPPTIALRTTEPASAERGERIATVIGCKGCHGAHGRIFLEVPWIGRIIAPDLARITKDYSEQELIVLVRAGIKRDKTSLVVMPTGSFSSLADADVADIVAWLRALKPEAQTETAETGYGPLGRFLALNGALSISATLPRDPAPLVAQPTAALALGDYYVKTICTHCHRLNEERELRPGLIAPPLRAMAQSYELAQLVRLLRTGKGIGDRDLGLMSEIAVGGVDHLTDEEIGGIHAYLTAPEEPSAAAAPAETTTVEKPAAGATGR